MTVAELDFHFDDGDGRLGLRALQAVAGDSQRVHGIRDYGQSLPEMFRYQGVSDDVARWQRDARQLLTAAHGSTDDLLLLVPDAGFRYLITGLRNPTAFDFPFVTTFGRDGQQRVVAAIASGRIKRVCLAAAFEPNLAPKVLVRYVRRFMRRGPQLGPCTLYTA